MDVGEMEFFSAISCKDIPSGLWPSPCAALRDLWSPFYCTSGGLCDVGISLAYCTVLIESTSLWNLQP